MCNYACKLRKIHSKSNVELSYGSNGRKPISLWNASKEVLLKEEKENVREGRGCGSILAKMITGCSLFVMKSRVVPLFGCVCVRINSWREASSL